MYVVGSVGNGSLFTVLICKACRETSQQQQQRVCSTQDTTKSKQDDIEKIKNHCITSTYFPNKTGTIWVKQN